MNIFSQIIYFKLGLKIFFGFGLLYFGLIYFGLGLGLGPGPGLGLGLANTGLVIYLIYLLHCTLVTSVAPTSSYTKNCEKCGDPADNEISIVDNDPWDFCSKCIETCPRCLKRVAYVESCKSCKTKLCNLCIDNNSCCEKYNHELKS